MVKTLVLTMVGAVAMVSCQQQQQQQVTDEKACTLAQPDVPGLMK